MSAARRWVYLPYAVVLLAIAFLGYAVDEYFAGIVPYLLLAPLFVAQSIRPTKVVWIVVSVGWLGLWIYALCLADTAGEHGIVAILALVTTAPLHIFRPLSKSFDRDAVSR